VKIASLFFSPSLYPLLYTVSRKVERQTAAMVVVDALHGDSAAAAADELFGGGTGYADLQAFFDHTVRGVVFLRGLLRFLDSWVATCKMMEARSILAGSGGEGERLRQRRGGAGVAVEQGCVPDGGDDGFGGGATADERRAAIPGGGGGEAAVPALRDTVDAAVARGPDGAPHALQRVRNKVQGRPPAAGVPAGEKPHLLLGAALQPS
jgi:hypothetical protein